MGARTIAAIIGALVLMIAGAFFFGGPVVRFVQSKLDRAEARKEQAVDQGVSNELETQGTATVGQLAADRAETASTFRARDAGRAQVIKANPDGTTPVPASLADELRRADVELCASGAARCRTDGGDISPDRTAGDGERDL